MKIFTLNNIEGLIHLASDGIISIIRQNQYGRKFFTLYGNGTFAIKDKLGKKGLGFSFFQGTWGFPVDKITDSMKSELQGMGIDISPLNSEMAKPSDQTSQTNQTGTNETQEVKQEKQDIQPETPEVELTAVEKELKKMKDGVDMAMKQAPNERVRSLLGFVDRMIERVAQMTDEAAQSDFIKDFMSFAAKFHSYSFHNQLLIWVQKPDATYVRGFKQWMELGREVVNWDNGITVIAPMYKKVKTEPPAGSKEEAQEVRRVYFSGVKVFDYSDTKPIAGWAESGKKVFEPASWRKDSNESTEELTSIVNALSEWAKSNSISVDYGEMGTEKGGFSAGGRIVINDKYQGINLFSTLVHECAHEVLHWEKIDGGFSKVKSKEMFELSSQDREIDAETTAFIVLQHYGFETKDTPNYLALWKAKGEDVKRRRDAISRAVKIIVEGIDKTMGETKLQDVEDASESSSVTARKNPEKIFKVKSFSILRLIR